MVIGYFCHKEVTRVSEEISRFLKGSWVFESVLAIHVLILCLYHLELPHLETEITSFGQVRTLGYLRVPTRLILAQYSIVLKQPLDHHATNLGESCT